MFIFLSILMKNFLINLKNRYNYYLKNFLIPKVITLIFSKNSRYYLLGKYQLLEKNLITDIFMRNMYFYKNEIEEQISFWKKFEKLYNFNISYDKIKTIKNGEVYMEKNMVLKYIQFGIKNSKILEILTQKQKKFKIIPLKYQQEKAMLIYKLINKNDESRIKLENIVQIHLAEKEDEEEFLYKIIEDKYRTIKLKERITKFQKYYMEIIDQLMSKEREGTKAYRNLKMKKDIYPTIFENLINDFNNLLFNYFARNNINIKSSNSLNKKEMLLIEQANLSQKEALKNAINERISIIQGPPGTGKTTTIINILANLLYRNKKVLVVSKNNSAIKNVAEELETMEIPKCYIRMREFRCDGKRARTEYRKIFKKFKSSN